MHLIFFFWGSYYLEFSGVFGPGYLFPSTDSGNFQPLFVQIIFLASCLFFFCDLNDADTILLGVRICSVILRFTFDLWKGLNYKLYVLQWEMTLYELILWYYFSVLCFYLTDLKWIILVYFTLYFHAIKLSVQIAYKLFEMLW